MRANGFEVRVHDVVDVTPHKQWLGVPMELASCHAAEVGGYAIEGHVPAADIKRLLAERTAYTTLLFDSKGRTRAFARH
jgi:hypothetical protein